MSINYINKLKKDEKDPVHALLDRLDRDTLDLEMGRQNLWRIDSKRQVVAWGFRGKEAA